MIRRAAVKGHVQRAVSQFAILLLILAFGVHADDAACIYALAGKSGESVKWLKENAATGFPDYPLFERDPFLDRIRKAPEFIQFVADEKAKWEKYRQEFGG